MSTHKFERRHYLAVANILSSIQPNFKDVGAQAVALNIKDEITQKFHDLFKADNPGFKADKFMYECLTTKECKPKEAAE